MTDTLNDAAALAREQADRESYAERIWVCDECGIAIGDEEYQRHKASVEWGHPCHARFAARCESHLTEFIESEV